MSEFPTQIHLSVDDKALVEEVVRRLAKLLKETPEPEGAYIREKDFLICKRRDVHQLVERELVKLSKAVGFVGSTPSTSPKPSLLNDLDGEYLCFIQNCSARGSL